MPILIPTPLRPFTGKQDAVEVAGATVGELLADLTRSTRAEEAPVHRRRQLRSFVNIYVNDEDIRYLQKEQTPVEGGRHGQHHPVGRGRRRVPRKRRATLPELTADGDQALQPAPDPARGRHRRAAEAEGREGAVHRRRRARLARRRCISPPPASARSASSTSTSSTTATCSGRSCTARPTSGAPKLQSAKDRLHALNPNVNVETLRRRRSRRRTRSSSSSPTTSSSTAPTTSRRGTW